MSLHSEWLSLIDVSGPFLAEPVLDASFSTGLPALDRKKRKGVRQAYYELRESQTQDDPDYPKFHRAWIQYILSDALEWDDDRSAQNLKSAADFGETYAHKVTGHGVTLNPELAFLSSEDELPSIFVVSYPPDTPLDGPINTDDWIASPAERMVELCRANTVRLGLITNGEHWMLIDAPSGGVTTFASWYSALWIQEPDTLRAFITLLDGRRFFLPAEDQLPSLLDKSLEFQDVVTDALGEQVRRAVEVLIQAFDCADTDRNQTLLANVKPAELYEAGLTIMMRIVFLLSAEERGLLLLGDERYETNYAITTLRRQLRETSDEELLEKRWDAWARLLALFRSVYGGVDHQTMRLPALGGSLFDPDRFPFLEGRAKGTCWKETEADPLRIDNKTVLLLLDAVQLFQGRTLSYRALDVEQIGYVYEGLLERTAVKAQDVTLDLDATKNANNPWVTLTELESAVETDTVEKLLKERTGSSVSRIRNDLARVPDGDALTKLLIACQNNEALRDKLAPYINFIRIDPWNYPLVYPKGSFMVAAGTDRRESGTHYTPKSLTEQIVETTLTPLAYSGPAEGKSEEEWELKPSADLLDLRICDPAMGSGAFLVQACRWLSEKLVEAWLIAEKDGKAITIDGVVVSPDEVNELAPDDLEERLIIAKRLVAERCLYGVDMNPLAVELAKLSIWLVTLSKGRPFGFLDHNLKTGDSLLGITSIEQLTTLTMREPEKASKKLFAHNVDEAVQKAIALRTELRAKPVNDIRDVEVMASLEQQAKSEVRTSTMISDALLGEVLAKKSKAVDTTKLSVLVGDVLGGHDHSISEMTRQSRQKLSLGLPAGKPARRPFHWPLEFPEIFSADRNGFDAVIGNPPFLGGKLIKGAFGEVYQKHLVNFVTHKKSASVDLVVHFLLRVSLLVRPEGGYGLIVRRSSNEAKNKEVGLRQVLGIGHKLYSVKTNVTWPGKASVVIHQLHFRNGPWAGLIKLNEQEVELISADLTNHASMSVKKIPENSSRMFQGTILGGEGFKVDKQVVDELVAEMPECREVLFPFIVGDTINSDPLCGSECSVICFWDMEREQAENYHPAFARVESEVFAERQNRKNNGEFKFAESARANWWRYLRPRPELYHAIGLGEKFLNHPNNWSRGQSGIEYVFGISTGTTKYPAFQKLPTSNIYSNTLCIVADDRFEVFAALTSDIHAVWAWKQRTTKQNNMESMRYAHGLIFETFPFPDGFLKNGQPQLSELGNAFYINRQSYMESENLGLTGFYNRFHDPKVDDSQITELRRAQASINQFFLELYRWNQFDLECGFHEVGYLPKGKCTRFSVSETARAKILNELSKLNQTKSASEENVVESEFKRKEKTAGSSTLDLFSTSDSPEAGST